LPKRSAKVSIAMVHEDQVEYSFFYCLLRLMTHDSGHSGHLNGLVSRDGTTGDLASGRNLAVKDFLESDSDWLWWIDTDMGFDPDTIDRLLEVADPVERPVVGGLCFGQRRDEADNAGGFRPVSWPTIMDWTFVEGRGGFQVRWDYPRDTVTQVHGTGSACILVHRSVFERVQAAYGGPPWDSWYRRVTNPSTGELVGEDLSFCVRLMQAQIPVFVHTGVQTTHRKNIWLSEIDYWRERALNPPPEAQPELDSWPVHRFAVVPTHNRPERLLSLVAALATQADTIVVLDNASDPPVDAGELMRAAGKARLEVLTDPEQPPHLSRFWNVLFDHCADAAVADGLKQWDVAVFNDDAIVPAGWFDVCATVLRGHETAAVAHTGTAPVHRHELVDAYPYPREKRMCPWAFVMRGEVGLRADESLRWWYFDDQLNRDAIDAGGVIAAPGPLVINANAVQSTVGVLAEQAEKDRLTFEAKWADKP
jgi:hypothetical protein